MDNYWKQVAENLLKENSDLRLKLMQVESDLKLAQYIVEDLKSRDGSRHVKI